MRIKVLAPYLIVLSVMLVVLIVALFAYGNGDGAEPPTTAAIGKGEFYFRVLQRDHLYTTNTWKAHVRVFPSTHAHRWPGVVIQDLGSTQEVSLVAILSIEGIHVPPSSPDYTRWHAATEREARRFQESMAYVWKLLSVAETCVIRNPREQNGIVIGQVFVVIGGNRLDIGQALVHDGHASRTEKEWGNDSAFVKDK